MTKPDLNLCRWEVRETVLQYLLRYKFAAMQPGPVTN